MEVGITAKEAAAFDRNLSARRPDAFSPNLAMSLTTLARSLAELGQHEEALAAVQDAVDIRHSLAERRPATFLPDLVLSLNNMSALLSSMGRREAALDAVHEAIEIYRELVVKSPDAFHPDLARSLGSLGSILGIAPTDWEAAAPALSEGIRVLKPQFFTLSDAFALLMHNPGCHYLQACEQLRQEPDDGLLREVAAAFEAFSPSKRIDGAPADGRAGSANRD
ncbi:MAG: tetratricopeptide repeat protein [Pseudomonadota bacterium]|nr:tetratricopeptide repeat protein [Pseudomonadota bacterium]